MLAKAKEWGNSIGIIIPSRLVKELNINPGDEVFISKIEKKSNPLKEAFGAMPELIDFDLKEFRKKELISKFD